MYYLAPKVKVYPNDREADIFDPSDDDFMEGKTRERPSEFDIHLAIYILECESVPDGLLEPVKQWARDNKKAGTRFPLLGFT